jgi:ADP-heptose:LPS heptosyltransferase
MNILIIHQGALGDFILSLPAIGAFRHAYPGSSIEIWGYTDILRLVEGRFYADAIASINRPGMSNLYSESASAPDALLERIRCFDLVVLFGGELLRTFADNLLKHGARTVCRISTFPEEGGETHVIDHQLLQLSKLGIQAAGAVPVLFPAEEDRRRARQFCADHAIEADTFTVALHMGSGSRKKAWPPGHCAGLAIRLAACKSARVVILTGPAETGLQQDRRELVSSGRCIMLDRQPLPELAAILNRCSVFVGNDSGITHLAAAAGVPVVSLFGPTDPRVWGPRGNDVTILGGGAACSPCSREKMQHCAHQTCLEHISVEEVYEAVVQGR